MDSEMRQRVKCGGLSRVLEIIVNFVKGIGVSFR